MGNTASGIDWNPGNSPLWNGGVDWNPGNSTVGQLAQGNFGEAGRGAIGGLQNLGNAAKDIGYGTYGALVAPYSAIDNLVSGKPQAAQRRQQDVIGQQASMAQQQAAADAANQSQAAQNAATQKNQDYLTNYNTQQAAQADADAFQKAKNAARQAKGTTLFGGFNG